MRFANGSEENKIFKEAYELAAGVSSVEPTGDAWAEYIKQLSAFAKRYKSPLAIRLAEAILDYAIDIEAIKKTEVQS